VPLENLVIQLRDLHLDREIRTFGISERLEPGESTNRMVELAGKTVSNQLAVQLISGRSPGSTDLVLVEPNDAIILEAELFDLRFNELIAPIPPHRFEKRDLTMMDGSVRIQEALIAEADVPVHLESTIPVPATVRLSLPDLKLDEVAFEKSYVMSPGSTDHPSILETNESLAGYSITFPELDTDQELEYLVEIEYDGSGSEIIRLSEEMGIDAELGSFTLGLEELTGIVEPRETTITPTRTTFSIPDEAEGLEFVQAALSLEIVNEAQVPGRIDLTATGTRHPSSASVSLQGDVAAGTPSGPSTTLLQWNESNSNVLELVNLRPNEILIEGKILIGDSMFVSTVRAGDRIRGRYEVSAPLKIRIGNASYRPDPFDFEISEDSQERIRENAIGASATLSIRNHLPAGATVSVQFGSSPEDVYEHPELTLDAVHVDPGVIDPLTGRVTEARVSEVTLAIAAEEIGFFARDRVYGGTIIVLDSTEETSVELLTTDAIEINGMVSFQVQVD
jgi:hypothetical protein